VGIKASISQCHNENTCKKVKKRKPIAVCATSTAPLWEPACHMGSHKSYLPRGRDSAPALTPTVTGLYSIYPPVNDERLSRPELTQANDLPRVAAEVLRGIRGR